MRLLNKCVKGTPAHKAGAIALMEHYQKYGDYGISERTYIYRVLIDKKIVSIRIVNSTKSYVARENGRARRLIRVWEENRV
ncbi:TPA: DUF4060 family protein [Enterobacter kobei]|nr:DUF4060 family protein [Enterobacter kobei]